jgi:S1-C subfamily serine protease
MTKKTNTATKTPPPQPRTNVVAMPLDASHASTVPPWHAVNCTKLLEGVTRICTADRTMSGTAFGLQHRGKSYVVTARHVVRDLVKGGTFNLLFASGWKGVEALRVFSDGQHDFVVIEVADGEGPVMGAGVVFTSQGLALAQDVYLLGFPLNLPSTANYVPYIRRGIASALVPPFIIFDAMSNPGQSGGPVVISRNDQPQIVAVVVEVQNDMGKGHAQPAGLTIALDIEVVMRTVRAT